ncbi:amidohydrolase family protein [Dyella sp. KRB-257]|uniref:amidohydrolase family protein n=1 Tax=Dyella sp. KRB-257 TaxID=3400915 RepID=UPI003C0A075C
MRAEGVALLSPYSDDTHNRGLLFQPQPQPTAMIEKAFGKGYQVCIHAIGDTANRKVLDSYAAAYKVHPEAKAFRNRVEHAQIVAVTDIPRFRQLDLIASMQRFPDRHRVSRAGIGHPSCCEIRPRRLTARNIVL